MHVCKIILQVDKFVFYIFRKFDYGGDPVHHLDPEII